MQYIALYFNSNSTFFSTFFRKTWFHHFYFELVQITCIFRYSRHWSLSIIQLISNNFTWIRWTFFVSLTFIKEKTMINLDNHIDNLYNAIRLLQSQITKNIFNREQKFSVFYLENDITSIYIWNRLRFQNFRSDRFEFLSITLRRDSSSVKRISVL